ncbi:MAG: hypothetical protein K9L89_02530 [Kiritimatiellales bacterium]|nr:hypothetical protein [Kiritimatiellales bacterium]
MRKQGCRMAGVATMAAMLVVTGCQSQSAASGQAKKGAGYGALTGAVSGFFWGLLRGNPIKGAATGAVVGAGTGAVVGGIHGSGTDRDLKAEFGEVNYKGLLALVHRDYPTAKEYAAQTADDPNPKYRHASAWLSALIAKETLRKDELGPYYDKLIELDDDVESREDARVEVRLAERDLKSLRKQFNVR